MVKGTSKTKTVKDLKKQPHYTDLDIEPIEVIEAWVEDFPSYLRGNILKYQARYKTTKDLEDLRKSHVYSEWLMEEIE